jgi:hypothetical protein
MSDEYHGRLAAEIPDYERILFFKPALAFYLPKIPFKG